MNESFGLIRFSHAVEYVTQWFDQWLSDSLIPSRSPNQFLKLCLIDSRYAIHKCDNV